MKRTIIRGTVAFVLAGMLVLGILVLRPASKVQARHGCSVGTLQGEYLFYNRNDAPGYAHGPLFPELVVGVRTFDGEGNLSQVWDRSRGGEITQGSQDTGVYTLGDDCIGTMLIAGDRRWDLFVTEDGSEGVAIRTDDGRIGFGTLKKR